MEGTVSIATASVDQSPVFVTLVVEENKPRPIPSSPRVGLPAHHRVWRSRLVRNHETQRAVFLDDVDTLNVDLLEARLLTEP